MSPLRSPRPAATSSNEILIALTSSERPSMPLPPTICSLSTTWMPSASKSTVLGAALASTVSVVPRIERSTSVRIDEPLAASHNHR